MDNGEKHLQDHLLDYTIIGAAHLARGITDFSLWSKAMLADGDLSIRPFLPILFYDSKRMFEGMKTMHAEPSATEPAELRKIKEELPAAESKMNAFLEGLIQSGSVLQAAEFVTRYKRYTIEKPEYFKDENWVEKLEAECKNDLPSNNG